MLRLPAAVTALALTAVLFPAPASALVPSPRPTPAPSSVPTPSGPSSAELNEQVDKQRALLAEQEAGLAAASRTARETLEAYQIAQRQAEEAARVAAEQAQRLAAAKQATEQAGARLAGYIGSMYRTGMGNRQLSLYSSALDAENPRELFSGLGLAQRVGGNQSNALNELGVAEAAQEVAAAQAAAADQAQKAAEAQAATAKLAADQVVAQLADQVAARTVALLRTQAAAAAALEQENKRASLLVQADLIARQRAEAPDAAIDGAFVPRPMAACQGQDTKGYPNGMIPPEALCPLWGTRGQILRADAAAAFNDMSKAYAQEFGVPICVTDSYRNYDEQVAVAAAKPDLAARPGSSNHGWGVATDLCDGIQAFGSVTHEWMVDNSMLFGWFLPSWAQQNGSKPEPWHWEFAG
ncbi:MAG: M15 family metallopeptidase [Actinobacteria bacterium]|nr:M15 family metallopeptidase [Actinomycetota bacterium]